MCPSKNQDKRGREEPEVLTTISLSDWNCYTVLDFSDSSLDLYFKHGVER